MYHLAWIRKYIRFSGSGAAHQNSVSERAVKTNLVYGTQNVDTCAMWITEGIISAELWPMYLDHAVCLYKHILNRETGLSLHEMCTRSKFSPNRYIMVRCHVWVCPTYLLEIRLHKTVVKITKWDTRSRRSAYMGFSIKYSTLLALVLNLRTKYISPKYHVVFYDGFTSVHINNWNNV